MTPSKYKKEEKTLSKTIVIAVALLLAASAMAGAYTVCIYADTAPNVYGSPAYTPWKTAAFAAAANNSFVNMQSGAYPGTTNFLPTEAIVYSTGDLGKRLQWIYWIPCKTTTQLNGLFQVKTVYDWGGVDYTYDWGTNSTVENGAEIGWSQPGSWVNYDCNGDSVGDGVMGTFGNAWWATDNLAEPLSTDASTTNETNAADVSALADMMWEAQTHWTGAYRFRDTVNDPWQYGDLRLTLVPEPASIFALFSGLAGIGLIRRRK